MHGLHVLRYSLLHLCQHMLRLHSTLLSMHLLLLLLLLLMKHLSLLYQHGRHLLLLRYLGILLVLLL